jgi:hypothetical protein
MRAAFLAALSTLQLTSLAGMLAHQIVYHHAGLQQLIEHMQGPIHRRTCRSLVFIPQLPGMEAVHSIKGWIKVRVSQSLPRKQMSQALQAAMFRLSNLCRALQDIIWNVVEHATYLLAADEEQLASVHGTEAQVEQPGQGMQHNMAESVYFLVHKQQLYKQAGFMYMQVVDNIADQAVAQVGCKQGIQQQVCVFNQVAEISS